MSKTLPTASSQSRLPKLISSGDKILLHAGRVQRLLDGDVAAVRPVSAHIYLTNSCNHKCSYCCELQFRKDYPGWMDGEFAIRLMDQLAAARVRSVVFVGGGEPTLHPQFLEIVERATDDGLKVGLITNGSKQAMVDAAPMCSWVRISMDGGTPEAYARIRGVGLKEFDRVLDNIRDMRQASPKLVIGVSYVLAQDSYASVESFLDLLADIPVTYVSLKALLDVPWNDQVKVSKEMLAHFSTYPRLRVYATGQEFVSGNAGLPCWASRLNATITADGKLYSCCRLVNVGKYELARMADIKELGFAAAWDSQGSVDTAKTLLDPEVTEANCPDCWMTKFNQSIAALRPEDLASVDFV